MFNLETELAKWRQAMSTAGFKFDVTGELEEHLRDDVDQQVRSGISESEAFQNAIERLGSPYVLRTEFDLVRSSGIRTLVQRHAWKIVLCSAIGVLAAVVVYALRPAMYVSEAKLFIRAIVADAPAGVVLEERVTHMIQGVPPDHVMRDEMELLSSRELAFRVISGIGREQILRETGGGSDGNAALNILRNGLLVEQVASGSAVIRLSCRNPDSTLVRPVLREVIEQYLRMHVEKHRAGGEHSLAVGRISNITQVRAPTQPLLDSGGATGLLATIVATGVGAGFAWIMLAAWLRNPDRRQHGVG